jgi:hypothetical protein
VHPAELAGAVDVVADYAPIAARRAAAMQSRREAYSHYRRAAAFVHRRSSAEQAKVLEARIWSAASTNRSSRSTMPSRCTALSPIRSRWADACAFGLDFIGSPATERRQ